MKIHAREVVNLDAQVTTGDERHVHRHRGGGGGCGRTVK